MIPKERHESLPKITYTETGWRQTLAAYRISVWHEHENESETAGMSYREALEKLGAPKPQNMQVKIGLVQCINDHMCMKDVYALCELIEPFDDNGTEVLRMVRILAEHGINNLEKFRDFPEDFQRIAGIGPKFALALEQARNVCNAIKYVDKKVTVVIPEYLHAKIKAFAQDREINLSELAKLAFEFYINTFKD